MAGETEKELTPEQLWEEVAAERAKEAGEESPSVDAKADPTPADEEKPEVDPEATEAKGEESKAEEPAKEADPWEGLPPAVKARLEKLDALEKQVAQIPSLQQSVKTAEGRVAAMQREMDVARQAAKTVGDAPTKAQIAAAAGSTEKWDALKSDFPEWASATEEFVAAKLAGLSPSQAQSLSQEQVDALIEQKLSKAREEAQQLVEEAKVEGKYGNWKEVINTDDFVNWFRAQPQSTQELAKSTKGRDAITLLDQFHAAKEKPAEEVNKGRAEKLAAAVTTKPNSQATATKSVEDMSFEELWEYERKRREKKAPLRY